MKFKCHVCGKLLGDQERFFMISSHVNDAQFGVTDDDNYSLMYCLKCFKDIAGEDIIEDISKNGLHDEDMM